MIFDFKSNLNDSNSAIVIGVTEDFKENKNFEELDALFNGKLEAAVDASIIQTKLNKVESSSAVLQTSLRKVYTVGLGNSKDLTELKLQEALGTVFQVLKQDKIEDACIHIDSFSNEDSFLKDIGLMGDISL